MNSTSDSQQLLNNTLALLAEKMNVDLESLSPESDLYAMGLDSITLMGLVAHWRAKGYNLDFSQLSRGPCANNWIKILQKTPMKSMGSDSTVVFGKANEDERAFSLSPMQHAYWVGRSSEQPLGGVSAHLYTEFEHTKTDSDSDGVIDPKQLVYALQKLTERHSSLRLKVTSDGKQIHQIDSPPVSFSLNDLRNETDGNTNKQLEERRQTFSSQILNVEAGDVLAIGLSLLPGGRSRLHLDIDMMAADAVSYRTVLRELAILYEDPNVELPELPMSYGDCRREIEKRWPDVEESSGAWWKNRLNNMPEGPQLPLKKESASDQPKTTRRHFHFNSELRERLYLRCREQRLTPASVLATILAETLAGWSKEPRFLINVPLFLRPMDGPDLSGVVGDFSSSVLLDVDLSQVETFSERAKHIQSRLHEDASHADYGGLEVLRELGRLKGRQIIVPIVFTSALNLGELFEPEVRRTFGDPVWIISQGPQVLLDTQITELDGGLLLNWDCREDAFIDGVLDSMFNFFRDSVLNLANKPEAWSRCLADSLPPERVQACNTFSEQPVRNEPAVQPSTVIERAVASVWEEVINCGDDNIHLNLFAAGGDSILATALVAKLREIFGVNAIDLKALFQAPSIAGLSASLVASSGFSHINHVATIYCEIIELDDDTLLAELEGSEL